MVEQYGADAVRFFILSDSPPEKDVQWSEAGMLSSYKFIQKFWLINEKIENIFKKEKTKSNEQIDIFVNQAIYKINFALDNFRYNVIIAVFHEIYSFFNKIAENDSNYSNLKDNYKKILIVMMPVIPHQISECWEKIYNQEKIEWPKVDKNFIESENCNIVIQINGKKRSVISTKKGLNEKAILEKIRNSKQVDKYIVDKNLYKIIYIKDKIINLIIKE